MKKFFALVLLLSFVACGTLTENGSDKADNGIKTEQASFVGGGGAMPTPPPSNN